MTGEGGREGGREGRREEGREGRGREKGWSEEGALYLIPGSIPSPLQISSFNL